MIDLLPFGYIFSMEEMSTQTPRHLSAQTSGICKTELDPQTDYFQTIAN